MKKYSSNRAGKGKTAFRTPSRWIKGQPEMHKNKHSHFTVAKDKGLLKFQKSQFFQKDLKETNDENIQEN